MHDDSAACHSCGFNGAVADHDGEVEELQSHAQEHLELQRSRR